MTGSKIFRGKSRKGIVFACVIQAYKKLNKPQNLEKIINLFNISKKRGLFGLRYLSMNLKEEDKIKIQNKEQNTVILIIKDIMEQFKANKEQIEEVLNIYNKIENKSIKINRSRPSSIASSLVYHWIKENKIKISLCEFSKKVNMSNLTIQKLLKEIRQIL